MENKDAEIETITLTKSASAGGSLGLTIKGGMDQCIFPKDPSVYVSRILKGGVAETSGLLNTGDRVLSVNDKDLRMVTHKDAVLAFASSPEQVVLKVERGAEEKAMARLASEGITGDSLPGPPFPFLPVTLMVIILGGAVCYMYYKHRNS